MKKGRWHRFGLVLVLVALFWLGTEAPMLFWVSALVFAVGGALYVNGPD